MIGRLYYYIFIIIGYLVLKYDNYNFWVGDDDKVDKNLYKKHKRVIKELEINNLFRLLGLKWLIAILITTISGNESFLGVIVVLIVIYDFYITIKKKASTFKKMADIILIIISVLNIILFIIFQKNNEIKLLFLIVSIIVEFTVMLRELKLYNKVKEL